MKKNILFFIVIFFVFQTQVNALWTNKTMVFGGLTRSYRVYQSPNYNPSNPASLIIALHGLGDNMTAFSGIGFHYIADTANIICIYPQAVSDPLAGTAWNSGAGTYITGYGWYYPNSTVNDIGFINALMDTAIANYSINIQRLYLCGFSMGGFMTERMALQSNTRIAAFGSMSGTIGNGITTFNPNRHVPIAHFHGTADGTVAFTGNSYGLDADSLINFWVGNNTCTTTPTIFSYPNTANDSITVERFEYSNGDPQSDVWFYKMYGADHTVLYQPTNDITEIYELWLFFIRHKLLDAGINAESDLASSIQIYPNPASSFINVIIPEGINENLKLDLYSIHGTLLSTEQISGTINKISIDGDKYSKGIYMLRIYGDGISFTKKVVIQK